jgi:hypothetical protein
MTTTTAMVTTSEEDKEGIRSSKGRLGLPFGICLFPLYF